MLVYTEPAQTYEMLRADVASPLIFLCDHSGQKIPPELEHHDWCDLRDKHVAYDIGAAHMTRYLSARFNAPAVLGVYSRLVVDLNRFRYDPTFTPEVSDGLLVEANQLADQAEIDRRTDLYFAPYHMAVSNLLDAIGQRQDSVNVILVHSMTNSFGGTLRPQHAEVMCDNDTRLAKPLLEAWRKQEGFVIGDNEPYRLDETDYTAITHCARRGLPHVQIEVRQDLIGTKENAEQWAERLAVAMEEAGIT